MTDIPLANAMLLYDSPVRNREPAFVVRPLGHDDYRHYHFKIGACFSDWKEIAAEDSNKLLAEAMIELWHISTFFGVPNQMIHEAMLVVPEYRNTLAYEFLPDKWRAERDDS